MISDEQQRERVRKWVDALRSGRFTQAPYALRSGIDPDGRCCLGVACEVYREETSDGDWTTEDQVFVTRNSDAVDLLPTDVADWFGFDHMNPTVAKMGKVEVPATAANDDHEWSFDRIADELEELYL